MVSDLDADGSGSFQGHFLICPVPVSRRGALTELDFDLDEKEFGYGAIAANDRLSKLRTELYEIFTADDTDKPPSTSTQEGSGMLEMGVTVRGSQPISMVEGLDSVRALTLMWACI